MTAAAGPRARAGADQPPPRRWLRRAVALLLVLAVSWLAFEWLGSKVLARRLARHYQLTVDHRMVPFSGPDINGDGIRSRREAAAFTEEGFNIVFLGDSFTYGYGLDDLDTTFPMLVERALDTPQTPVRVANFAWVSSSPLLSSRLLADIGAKYRPDLVVLCLDVTDFYDDVKYARSVAMPRVSATEFLLRELGLGWLVMEWQAPSWWPRTDPPAEMPRPFFIVNQPLAASRPLLAELEHSVRAIAARCRDELGADFVLILLPRHFQYNPRECPRNWEAHHYSAAGEHVLEPFRWLAEFRDASGLACYSLLECFRDTAVFPTCFEDDPHWNEDGHRVAAACIVTHLRAGVHVPEGAPRGP